MRYLVSKEIKSETKVGKSIYLFDFFFLIVYMAVSFVLVNLVHPSLHIAFYLFSFVMALLLTTKSYTNKKRRNYQSIAIMLRKDQTVDRSVGNVSRRTKLQEEEELKRVEKTKGQEKGKRKKKQEKPKVDKVLQIRGYDKEAQCYLMKNGGFMDLIQINSKDLVNSSADEVEYDCMKFAKEYKLEEADLKLIVLNFPCDTKRQQAYYEIKLEQTKNAVYKNFLQKKLDELIWLGKNDTTREFYFMLFAKSHTDLEKQITTLKTVLHTGRDGLLIELTDEKKHQIIYRLNNKGDSLIA